MDDAALASDLTKLFMACRDLGHAEKVCQHVKRKCDFVSVKAVAEAIDATTPPAPKPEHKPLPDYTGGLRDITDESAWPTAYLETQAARMRAEMPVIMQPFIQSFEKELSRRREAA